MQPIEGNLYSPFQQTKRNIIWNGFLQSSYEDEIIWQRYEATVNRVRASPGFPVLNFRQLVDEVANVTLSNKRFEMYYRGQSKDYKNNQSTYYSGRIPKTDIFPTICRPELNSDGSPKYSVKKTQILKRYENLEKLIERAKGRRYNVFEYHYSLFQHYDIAPTPFIDITQSLRVAATFALRKSNTGYLYVFGLPYPNQSISYYADMGIILIKLQNVSPVEALRPRYQEGYLVGKYPIRPTKTTGDNLANRLVAKFFLDNTNGTFWDEYFLPMPDEILFPNNDTIEIELSKIKM